eukprot:11189729-Lingulodinium_polyedra.AAC.1
MHDCDAQTPPSLAGMCIVCMYYTQLLCRRILLLVYVHTYNSVQDTTPYCARCQRPASHLCIRTACVCRAVASDFGHTLNQHQQRSALRQSPGTHNTLAPHPLRSENYSPAPSNRAGPMPPLWEAASLGAPPVAL